MERRCRLTLLLTTSPSTEEQQEIVKRVDALFAQADALEAQYESLKAKIEKLPQALLAKAFRGELVPQDPTDEPASVLLQKIKAEAAKGGKKKEKNGQIELAF
ncbi:type I restriction-modification system subunit S [Runella slithyformis]|uniref:Type I restriction-modification system, S subunit n=1 Tax=Runella slithyformis (strain ATCC 29530 / DSM 19594 / LMG 11500 / NCIMB 11436 / LSU 4) TaxID=761193 RepID=A0A7U4E6X2_RUNSL|nr:type I restriction-modification system subunit S [Runella slithyformis]AEI49708.1 type I restriction-modification system, S subunit [Runella slithyformis DSM 19594]